MKGIKPDRSGDVNQFYKKMNKKNILTAALLSTSILVNTAHANVNSEIRSIKSELNAVKKLYEERISDLEKKLKVTNSEVSKNSLRSIYSNDFNPSIGIVLNGTYSNFSKNTSEIAGFAIGEEGERGREGFSIGESELNFSSNIDDKFYGSVTAAIVREDGSDIIELEEAYVRTTPGLGLPTGFEIKAGRALWKLGYLNEHHAHTDDFADRPLPYRVFLNKAFNDDGVQLSYVLPTSFYTEIGGGSFVGDDFPFGSGDGTSNYSAFLRVGGDIGTKQNWRIGASVLSGESKAGRVTNETTVTFTGNTDLFVADLRYNFAPTGNAKNQEFTLQGEYFYRDEDGTYNDTNAGSGDVIFDDNNSGFYTQATYKFKPQWRAGLRYSKLFSSDTPTGLAGSVLDANDHDPETYSTMIDWTNSEFSRIRFQYNHEELSRNNHDNQVMIQYVMSFGAHSAHKY